MDERLPELLASAVDVSEKVDERVSFYLNHRALIEAWALLRREAGAAVENALYDLADPLAGDLRCLGVDPVVTVHDGRWPAVCLARAEWSVGASGGSPIVVGLEWDKTPVNSRGDLRVYAAVIAPRGHSLAGAYDPALKGLSNRLRAQLGRDWKQGLPRWPVFQYVDAPTDPWSLAAIANEARRALLRLWIVAAPEIDQILRFGPSGAGTDDLARNVEGP